LLGSEMNMNDFGTSHYNVSLQCGSIGVIRGNKFGTSLVLPAKNVAYWQLEN